MNILVNDSQRALITDFGLSAIWTDKALSFASMTSGPTDRSIRWSAPELFEEGALPNRASDIWAFGCVCYEVRVHTCFLVLVECDGAWRC